MLTDPPGSPPKDASTPGEEDYKNVGSQTEPIDKIDESVQTEEPKFEEYGTVHKKENFVPGTVFVAPSHEPSYITLNEGKYPLDAHKNVVTIREQEVKNKPERSFHIMASTSYIDFTAPESFRYVIPYVIESHLWRADLQRLIVLYNSRRSGISHNSQAATVAAPAAVGQTPPQALNPTPTSTVNPAKGATQGGAQGNDNSRGVWAIEGGSGLFSQVATAGKGGGTAGQGGGAAGRGGGEPTGYPATLGRGGGTLGGTPLNDNRGTPRGMHMARGRDGPSNASSNASTNTSTNPSAIASTNAERLADIRSRMGVLNAARRR